MKRQFDEAAAIYLTAIQELPTFPVPYRGLAACYAHMGRLAEAREAMERLRVLSPVIEGSYAVFRNPEYRELLRSGLRLAMGVSA